MNKYRLKLYVAGHNSRSERAIRNLTNLCEQLLPERYELEIIDVLERPELAEDEKILATPTLIRELPPPQRRVIGDLSDVQKVIASLDLSPAAEVVRGQEGPQ